MKIKDLKVMIKEAMDDNSVLLKKPSLLKESGLSRVYHHIEENECAIISAHRTDPTDISLCDEEPSDIAPDSTNKLRNRDLKATLLAMGFGVTKIDGSYIENFSTPEAIEVKEDSLFCVNLKDDTDFIKTIQELGKKYCQDSVLIIPQGGSGAYLYGTNNAQFPGLDQTVTVGDVHFGDDAEFMSRVNKRPFTFSENKLEVYEDLSRNQRMAVKAIAKPFINEIRKEKDGKK